MELFEHLLTTPWGIELHENVLVLVFGNLLEILSYQYLNWFCIPVFWHFFRA